MTISSWTRFYRNEAGARFGAVHVTMTDAQVRQAIEDAVFGPVFSIGSEVIWFTSLEHPVHQTVWVRNHPSSGVGCMERDEQLGTELAAAIPSETHAPIVTRLAAAAAALDGVLLPAGGAKATITVTLANVEQDKAIRTALDLMSNQGQAWQETRPDRILVHWPDPAVPLVIELVYPGPLDGSPPADGEPLLYLERPELLGLPRRPAGTTVSAS